MSDLEQRSWGFSSLGWSPHSSCFLSYFAFSIGEALKVDPPPHLGVVGR